MTNDYEVFQPSNESIAQVIVEILADKGYVASYQLGYPHNKLFLKANSKEQADKILEIIEGFMKQQDCTGVPSAELNALTTKLAELLPQAFDRREEVETIPPLTATVMQSPMGNLPPMPPTTSASSNGDLEELRKIIAERIQFLNAQTDRRHRKDRLNEMRAVEIDTLNWVLRNMP